MVEKSSKCEKKILFIIIILAHRELNKKWKVLVAFRMLAFILFLISIKIVTSQFK